ncbi:MAG: alpha/beta fold hydrolase, partial [Bacteroidota bacterium]
MPAHQRLQLRLTDGDDLHYDHYQQGSDKVVIISHGLEGNSKKSYVLGLAKILYQQGYDIIAWNFRSCHGELNKTRRFYHSGATDDLHEMVKLASTRYEKVCLAGYSLGANLTLKYAGERPGQLTEQLHKIAAVCVPLNLRNGSLHLKKGSNVLYTKRFLKSLKQKIKTKEKVMPGTFNVEQLGQVKDVYDFDEYFTAPIHGFLGADDYYQQCSAINFITDIQNPTLVINAVNDPLIPVKSFDHNTFNSSKNVILELTKSGGHCGFPGADQNGNNWVEHRIA